VWRRGPPPGLKDRRNFMEIDKFVEVAKKLDSKKKGKKEELEKFP
jgi:hypothetical protein